MHLNAHGAGSPVVVLEAGIAGSSVGWALVEPEIARFTRVCSYDRAGLGWSDAANSQLSLGSMNDDLAALLSAARIPPPYVLAGHSFGGLLARNYACTHPEQIAGLVILDPPSVEYYANCTERERKRLSLGVRFSRRGAFLARFGIVRLALALLQSGGPVFAKMIGRVSAGRANATMLRLVGEVQKLPPETWPVIASHWSHPKAFTAMAAHLAALPACAENALGCALPPQIPLTILSASTATPAELSERDRWAAESGSGKHVILEQCGHWIQLEQPAAVVRTIKALVLQQRAKNRPDQ